MQQVMNYYGMFFNYLPELLYKDTEKKLIYCKILLIPVNNYEYILHIAWSKECRNTCFILEKRKKNRLHIDVFFLPNITPPPPPLTHTHTHTHTLIQAHQICPLSILWYFVLQFLFRISGRSLLIISIIN